jgi:hypothetical protein
MTTVKQRLIDRTKSYIAAKEREVKESDVELEMLEADLKIEKRIFGAKDMKAVFKDEAKYGVETLESMILMEREKNAELKKEIEIEKNKLKVIGTFGAGEL